MLSQHDFNNQAVNIPILPKDVISLKPNYQRQSTQNPSTTLFPNPFNTLTTKQQILQVLSQNLINMNDSNQNFDNYPIMNSFLTTIQEYSLPSTPKETINPLSKQVDEWFQAQAKMLQAKKERQLLKQNRLKQLEQEFQMQRVRKQKEMEEKLASIEKNKIRNISHIQEKFQKISARHSKVLVRIQDESIKEMEKNYDSRKAYEMETQRRSSRMINTSQNSSNGDRHKSLRDYKTKTVEQEDIKQRINTIDNRLQKAKTMYKERQEETVNKVRIHNVYDLYQAQNRAREHSDEYLKMYATKILNKMETAESQKDKIQKQIEKKNQEKQKSYGEKLKRIHNNLTQLQEEKEMRFQELSKKFQKTNRVEKGGKNTRETLYLKKFRGNLQQLQKQKVERANQIIQKHQQISLKNRLFKEKKESLYKTLKVEAQ